MRHLLFSLLAVPVLAAGIFVVACSDEGEGQPCSLANGSNDCQANLICMAPPGRSNSPAVCCPQNPAQATTPECALPGGIIDASSAPPDARTTETSTHDSPAEAEGEAGADGSADGAGDAPAESAADGGGTDAPTGG